uniref:Galectin n=2 Tax=Esox lucius TaxID=8010 RepID=A0AAY5K7M4_ESOLU
MTITVKGMVKPNAKKFALNLSKGNDIALHVNPRFDEMGKKTIVCNSMIGGRWGKEERHNTYFPFIQGNPFEMKIMCTDMEFKVAVNNIQFIDFKNRIHDLASIKMLDVHCDITLTSVDIISI